MDGIADSVLVTLTEREPGDNVFIYEDGILLIEGVNYFYNTTTGAVVFNNYIPDEGTIIIVQLLKQDLVSGIFTSAINVSFNPAATPVLQTNTVQDALVELAAKTYTKTQLETIGQALVIGENVRGTKPQNTIIDEITAITWRGTLTSPVELQNVQDPVEGDVYAILSTETIVIYKNGNFISISTTGGTGAPGADGQPGLAAIFPILRNLGGTIVGDIINGNIVIPNSSFEGTGTNIQVFEGANELNYNSIATNLSELNNGEFRILASGTAITPGQIVAAIFGNQVFVDIQDHSNFTGSGPASVSYEFIGKRYDGTVFQVFSTQRFTLVLNGEEGLPGNIGATGPQGPAGPTGPEGTSVVLKGSVNLFSDLDNIVDPDPGDLYVVLADGNGYV